MMKKLLALTLLLSVVPVLASAVSPAANSENVVKVLRTTNKAQTNQYVCETFEFKNINPYDVVNFFWAVTSREEGGIYAFAHPQEERGYIVAICPEYQLPNLRKLAEELDQPGINSAPGSKYIYHRLRHRNVTDPGFLATVSYYMGSSGVIMPDVETNSLNIWDAPEGAAQLDAALDEILDKPAPQVELGVKIYEISVKNDGKLGLDYVAWKNGPGRYFAAGQVRSHHMMTRSSRDTQANGHTSGLYLDYPSAFFDFLVQKGKAKILTATKMTTLNRVPALMTAGEQIRYWSVYHNEESLYRTVAGWQQSATAPSMDMSADDSTVYGGNMRYPFNSGYGTPSYPLPQFPQQNRQIQSEIDHVDTGVSVLFVPTIGEESIDIGLEFKVASCTGYDGAGAPMVSSREITDDISVANGEEVVFGGLNRTRIIEETEKIPFLGSLPGFGWLFGGETQTNEETIVVVAVTPNIVTGGNAPGEDDEAIMSNVTDADAVVQLPTAEYGFEQGFDRIF